MYIDTHKSTKVCRKVEKSDKILLFPTRSIEMDVAVIQSFHRKSDKGNFWGHNGWSFQYCPTHTDFLRLVLCQLSNASPGILLIVVGYWKPKYKSTKNDQFFKFYPSRGYLFTENYLIVFSATCQLTFWLCQPTYFRASASSKISSRRKNGKASSCWCLAKCDC